MGHNSLIMKQSTIKTSTMLLVLYMSNSIFLIKFTGKTDTYS